MIKKIFIPFILLLSATFIYSLDVPDLKGYVNDYADMISSEAETELETKLKAFDDSDSTQIVILTIPSLEGDALEDFSIKVAEKWKIGQKNKDNGAIFLVSKNDRKMRIEVGYGLEGVITDLLAGRIIDNAASPHFRNGDMDKGFAAVIDALIGASKGEYTSDKLPEKSDSKDMTFPFMLFIIMIIIWFSISRIIPFKIRGWLGGVFGATSLPLFLFFNGLRIVFAFIILSIIGFVFGAIFTLIFSSSALRTGRAGRTFSRFGGFSSGGRSGGFSGFSGGSSFRGGGGSFGGGGASGGW